MKRKARRRLLLELRQFLIGRGWSSDAIARADFKQLVKHPDFQAFPGNKGLILERVENVAANRTGRQPKKVVGLDGPPCPRCGCATEVREHKQITEKQLKQPFYYSRWYNCRNTKCKTTLIMPAEHRVFPACEPQPDDDAVAPPRQHDRAQRMDGCA